MKRIGLFSNPINPGAVHYRGIYRENGLIEYLHYPALSASIQTYFRDSWDGNHKAYDKPTKESVKSLFGMLASVQWQGDCILFDDCPDASAEADEGKLLGFDICGSGQYDSPLGDLLLEAYDEPSALDAFISRERFWRFHDNLNENGLFSSYAVAREFADLCCSAGKEYDHAVETEENWHPVSIYLL